MSEELEHRRDDWRIVTDSLRTEIASLRTEVSTLVMQNLEIKDLWEKYHELDKILVRGNGKPSLMEDVRNLLLFMKSIQFWMTALALAFIGQFASVTVVIVFALIKLIPAN